MPICSVVLKRKEKHMKIKFYEVIYPLHDAPNVEPSHFQASLEYSGETLASIISEVENSTQIDVYDDEDNLTATYRNYTDLVAVCYGGAENPVVSVEFNNVDVQAQIDNLAREVEEIQTHAEPFVIDVPASSGNTTTVLDNRVSLTSTVINVQNYNTGLEVENITVKPIDGALIIGNITDEIALKITLI